METDDLIVVAGQLAYLIYITQPNIANKNYVIKLLLY